MDLHFDSLKNLLILIKEMGLWTRLFAWKKIKNLLVDANADFRTLISNNDMLKEGTAKLEASVSNLSKDLQMSREDTIRIQSTLDQLNLSHSRLSAEASQQIQEITKVRQINSDLDMRIREKEAEINQLKLKIQNDGNTIAELKKLNTELEKDDVIRKNEQAKNLETINKIREQIQNDRNREIDDRNQSEIERLNRLKETWGKHQTQVKNTIKAICNKHTIEYVEKPPFKGEPDNTVKICDEYVIFDAKSPASDDLSNFPNYLKDQAEKAKKYAKQDGVKLDIFLVVPSNTLGDINQFVYNMADYNVFVVSLDTLEPLILSLLKIEEYEFAEQLTPDERDNICRVLGKFAHLSKRRIQIDGFFAKQFLELAYKSESDLPKDIFEKVVEFEKAEKLNPPIEKRAKAINTKELEKDTDKISNDAKSKGINTEDNTISNLFNELPLYKK